MNKLMIVMLILLSSCVEQTKELISDVKSNFNNSSIGKRCDIKNKVICYEQNHEAASYSCVSVEKPMCKKEEEMK